jgi:transcriptional regulator with XRE-family HTH domain
MSATESAPQPQPGQLARVISANVKALMTQRGVSQHQLASALGMPQTSIGKRLRGDTNWTADDIEAVALAFEVDVIGLLQPAEEVSARPLRPVVRDLPHRRRSGVAAGPRDAHVSTDSVTSRYRQSRALVISGRARDVRDEWRISRVPGSHELPIVLRRHAGNPTRCRRVAA